jgi:hypothetical protein
MKKMNYLQLYLVWAVTLVLSCTSTFGQNNYINPRGTFQYVGKTIVKNDDTYGYFGTIQVKTLSNNKIVMTFYICIGAMSYNSGSFVDTLYYKNNVAVHKEEDCITTFVFTGRGIDVKEASSRGSCWGGGVIAHGHFRRESSKQPVLVEPLTGEKLK